MCRHCALAHLCLPSALKQDEVASLELHIDKQQQFDSGDHIYRLGDVSSAIYVLRFGIAKTYRSTAEGEMQIIGLHLPGELFGLDALRGKRHAVSVEALEKTSVCALPVSELDRIMRDIPAVNRQVMQMVSQRVDDAGEGHSMVAGRSALGRVALFLQRYRERLDRAGQRSDSFRLALSRQDMANYLGLTIETVSRTISKLRDDDVIEVDRRLIGVIDPARLQQLAGAC